VKTSIFKLFLDNGKMATASRDKNREIVCHHSCDTIFEMFQHMTFASKIIPKNIKITKAPCTFSICHYPIMIKKQEFTSLIAILTLEGIFFSFPKPRWFMN
jgi:hypothetical protein